MRYLWRDIWRDTSLIRISKLWLELCWCGCWYWVWPMSQLELINPSYVCSDSYKLHLGLGRDYWCGGCGSFIHAWTCFSCYSILIPTYSVPFIIGRLDRRRWSHVRTRALKGWLGKIYCCFSNSQIFWYQNESSKIN